MTTGTGNEKCDVAQNTKQSRSMQTAWIAGAIGVVSLALGFVAGSNHSALSASGGNIAPTATSPGQDASDVVASAKGNVDKLQEEYDAALEAVELGSSGSTYPPDPRMVASMRRATELEELSCRKYGTNCEDAELMRRQLNEMQSGL